MVTRVVMIGVASAAVAACAITGCSNSSSTGTSATTANNTSTSGSTSVGAASASGTPTVLVDGQPQNVSGPVTCTAAESDINVTLGDASSGVGAVISNDSPPAVHSVGLGNVNGVTLGYADAAAGHGNASATKTGNSYKITGTAVGLDASNQQQVTKPFELDFTCP
ncbi:lipoprotein LpqH [Mycolicibacterium brisbanense]|uniref:Lipoprotein LpqH n=1 Tax=Mycolicibacterium brisbanense TaxID=146020 RepID=A0A100VTV2_9MYCO|nr:lipoprotein LpqH [Mycolicibacterium brisbanense]MCV7161486.1 lipoprotein LpqH [Mycolicibacterium brisbanense]GAS86011.1 lipoprotein LpqH [Mycolicibacterium brisbanense]